MKTFSFLFIVLLTFVVREGAGLHCYRCTTPLNDIDNVGNELNCDAEPLNCGAGEVCYNYKTVELEMENIKVPSVQAKGCGPKEICIMSRNFMHTCLTCDSEMCNAASSTVPAFTLIISAFIYILFKML